MYASGGFSAIFDKGDKYCDFLLAFMYTNIILKRGILLFRADSFQKWVQ